MGNVGDEKCSQPTGGAGGRIRPNREVDRRALDALGPHVQAIRKLAEAATERANAECGVDTAREHAAELVTRARSGGADLIRTAETARRDARLTYRDLFATAIATGWTAEQLDALGYDRILLRPRGHRPPNPAGVAPDGAA